MNFVYEGCNPAGDCASGEVDAGDVMEAIETLRRRGLFVSKIHASQRRAAHHALRGRRMFRGRLLRNLAMFTRQLHVLTSTGTPLVDALHSLERQSRDAAWRDVVSDVRDKVEQGESLAEAMAHHPRCFDAVCRSLISAGETGGGMDKMLDRLATLSRKQLQLRSAIMGAMIYPCLLVGVAISVLALMLLFVLPRFGSLFQSMDLPLPATTRFLLNLSDFIQSSWWMVLIAALIIAAIVRFWSCTDGGKELLHRAVLHTPIIGPLIRSLQMARIVRVLGVLIAGKVPLLQALGLARATAGNLHYARLIARAESAVSEGGAISSVFSESDLVEPSLCEAVRSGEKSGELGTLLLNMADFMDEENEVVIRSLTSVLEPVILIVLGLLVGLVAMSMFLPMFDMTSMTQRGA